MALPQSIAIHLPEIKRFTLFGKPILDYSKEELATFIVCQNEQRLNDMKEKHRQMNCVCCSLSSIIST